MDDEYAWHELNLSDIPDGPLFPQPIRRVRLYADEDIPDEVIEELQGARVSIISGAKGRDRGRPDSYHYVRARRLRRVLLTRDEDYWDERRFPTASCGGLILISGSGSSPQLMVEALAFLWASFARYVPAYAWQRLKVKCSRRHHIFRLIDAEGAVSEDEYHWERSGKIMTRRRHVRAAEHRE
jgi:hypothetical protein